MSPDSGLPDANEAERKALHELIEQQRSRVAGMVHRHRLHWNLTRTTVVVDDVFMRLRRHAGELSRKEAHEMNAILARAVESAIIDLLRQKSAERRGGRVKIEALPEIEPGDGADEAELVRRLTLEKALEELRRHNERWWTAVYSRYYSGHGVKEIGLMLGVIENTARVYLREGERFLRERITTGAVA